MLETEEAGNRVSDTLEVSQSSGRLVKGVLCILGPAQELVPRILVVMAEGSQESLNLLDLSFHLPS